ncbi:MAG: hypothetical protein DDT33_01326 [Firmicutes bacterium]|nr:hypothetical protein [Bacillota bacterium]
MRNGKSVDVQIIEMYKTLIATKHPEFSFRLADPYGA